MTTNTNTNKLYIEDYSEKSIVVRGTETKTHKEGLKNLGGKYNMNLKGQPGWVFPKTKSQSVQAFISNCLENNVNTNQTTLSKNISTKNKLLDELLHKCFEIKKLINQLTDEIKEEQDKEKVNYISNVESKTIVNEDFSDSEESEVIIPRKRLL
jgi:hypothetical protein